MSNETHDKDAQEERFGEVFAHLREQDIEQFYAHYQLWVLRRRLPMLEKQLEALREHLSENQQVTESLRPSALALAVLVRLQSNGVSDIDVLDLMLDRGEDWLDRMMQRLDYCEQVEDFIQGDYTQWCIRSLEGAYDWIDSLLGSIKEEPGRRNNGDDGSEATEALLLQKLSQDDEEAMLRVSPEQPSLGEVEDTLTSAEVITPASDTQDEQAPTLPEAAQVEAAAEMLEEREAAQQAELIGWKDLEDLEAPGEGPLPWYSVDVTANGATSTTPVSSMNDWITILQSDASAETPQADQWASETEPTVDALAASAAPETAESADDDLAATLAESEPDTEASVASESHSDLQADLVPSPQTELEIPEVAQNADVQSEAETHTTADSATQSSDELVPEAEPLTVPSDQEEEPSSELSTSTVAAETQEPAGTSEQSDEANATVQEVLLDHVELREQPDEQTEPVPSEQSSLEAPQPASALDTQVDENAQPETPQPASALDTQVDENAQRDMPEVAAESTESQTETAGETSAPLFAADEHSIESVPTTSVETSAELTESAVIEAESEAAQAPATTVAPDAEETEPVPAETASATNGEEELDNTELAPVTASAESVDVESQMADEAAPETTSEIQNLSQPQTSEQEVSEQEFQSAASANDRASEEEETEGPLAWYEYLDLEEPLSTLAPTAHEERIEPEEPGETTVEEANAPELHEYAVVTQSADEQSPVPGPASVREETIESENWQSRASDEADATLPLPLKEIQRAQQMHLTDQPEQVAETRAPNAEDAIDTAVSEPSAEPTLDIPEQSTQRIPQILRQEDTPSRAAISGTPEESHVESRRVRRAIEEQPTLQLTKLETPRIAITDATGTPATSQASLNVSPMPDQPGTDQPQVVQTSKSDAQPPKKRGFWWRLFHFGRKK